jgi:asparagine synthase (glutamine-hydrolysing)
MCGIAGLFYYNNEIVKQHVIDQMTDTLIHRGPDDSGTYVNDNIGLGHRRLSILDLSILGHQPMVSDCGNYIIVYNGEIYNFHDLRKTLQESGYVFKSQSDTEVILKGFQCWKASLFKKLNGIFSIAIWSRQEKELYLVRDRLGVKPLYVYRKEEAIYFASEIKAIRSVCEEINKVDYEALSAFMFYGNSLGTKTLYKNISSVQPGSYLLVKDNDLISHTYWRPEDLEENTNISLENAAAEVKYLLENGVKRQLLSDVPVGIFLSGGIDSSAITAFASKHYSGRLKTFSASFEFDNGNNELSKARFVAEKYQTDHVEFFVAANNLPEVIEQMVYHHDEPFSDAANIPLYLMAKQVKSYASVILQGDGGDELFGGYNRYFLLEKYGSGFGRKLLQRLSPLVSGIRTNIAPISRILRMVNAFGQKNDAMMMAFLLTMDTYQNNTTGALSQPMKKELFEFDPFQYYKSVHERFKNKSLLQRMLYVDTQIILPNTFLEKVDKSTMAASVEVRVPFLDNDLVDFVMSLPSGIKLQHGEKKFLLKKALRNVVPDEILEGPKTGFGVPYENWLRGPLYNFMNDRLHSKYIRQLSIFNYSILDKMIMDHKNSKGSFGFQLWKLMNLSIWLEENKISLN